MCCALHVSRRQLALLSTVLLTVLPVFARPAADRFPIPPVMSIGFTSGFWLGHSEEIVYRVPLTKIYLSELLWDIPVTWTTGVSFMIADDYEPVFEPGNFFTVSLQVGIPLAEGTIEDRDWLAANNSLSHYSRHDTVSRTSVQADFSYGHSIPLLKSTAIRLHFAFTYHYLAWDAYDGYYRYGKLITPATKDTYAVHYPWDSEDVQTSALTGKVLSYVQNWFIPKFGTSIYWEMNSRVNMEATLYVSPIILFYHRDDHWLPDIIFEEFNFWGAYIEPAVQVSFSLNKKARITGEISFRRIWTVWDTRLVTETLSKATTPEWACSGSGVELFTTQFGFVITL